MVKIGIIGGTGLENPDLLKDREEKDVTTSYGKPSDVLVVGKIGGIDVVILSRHGRKHNINPSNVNYRANLLALKEEGCTHIVVTTACGSLQEELQPGDFMIPDQFIDRTTKRIQTYYDGEQGHFKGVCHIPASNPFSKELRNILSESASELGYRHQPKGTVVCIEGPRFSSYAESCLFRSWGAHLVNMTLVPEVILANELGIPYGSLAIATDYDCWKSHEVAVNVENVIAVLKTATEKACNILKKALPKIAAVDWTPIQSELDKQLKISVMHSSD